MKKSKISANDSWVKIDFKEFFEFRWVCYMLIVRDIKLRYKETTLGIAWVVLQPLLSALLLSLVFGKMIKMASDGIPYLLFAFCGLIPWLAFSQSLQRASNSLINDSRLITRVYFPRLFIPLSATLGVGIDYIISLIIMGVLLIFYKHPLTAHILLLPVCTLVLFLFSVGFNFLISALNVYYRDFKHIIPFLVQLWMYASPLMYSGNMIPEKYRLIYSLNPIAGIIDLFRFTFLGGNTFPLYSSVAAGITSLLCFIFGTLIFRKMEHSFADLI